MTAKALPARPEAFGPFCYSASVKLSRDAAFWLIAIAATIVLTLVTWFVSR
ncbi:MAG: hypothetical protein WAL32_14210 [Terriglobales bacterium]